MITISNLSKKYGSNTILRNINITFKEGIVYGVIGKNGAGKTTFFNCIAALEDYQGKITTEKGCLKNKLGFLPTENFFFNKMTGREYIKFMTLARDKKVTNIERKNIFNLPLDQYVSTYSSGMKKKLAFSAVIMQENDYYIFDEPFNGIDIESNMILFEIIAHLKKQNKCIILSSHIFSTLKEGCDIIHIISNGNISSPIYKDEFSHIELAYKKDTIGRKIEDFFDL